MAELACGTTPTQHCRKYLQCPLFPSHSGSATSFQETERQQRQRRTPTLYVGLALEDASEKKTLFVSVESADKFDNCALAVSPKELAKENKALERVRVGTRRHRGGDDGKRNPWQMAVARKEAKGKRKVAREKQEHVGRAA